MRTHFFNYRRGKFANGIALTDPEDNIYPLIPAK